MHSPSATEYLSGQANSNYSDIMSLQRRVAELEALLKITMTAVDEIAERLGLEP